jgi:UPF0176 protein
METISLPAEQQKLLRQGINKGPQVFKKGRSETVPFIKKPH